MKRTIVLWAAIILAGWVAGCKDGTINLKDELSPGQGTTRGMGNVSYPQAFAAARQVMSQYYSIDPTKTNVNDNMIVCRPKNTDASRERLLGSSPARQVARMHIFQKGGQIVARVLVMQQRQGSHARRRMTYSTDRTNYSGDPGSETPGDLDAATTSEQNVSWTNEKPLHDIESNILADLYKSLHGGK
ncbi:MAG: hypothetical protein K8S55_07580 [Phycisphaerae bacterium]|nr:hypothetical protein [Phycisphaerae bacterium]